MISQNLDVKFKYLYLIWILFRVQSPVDYRFIFAMIEKIIQVFWAWMYAYIKCIDASITSEVESVNSLSDSLSIPEHWRVSSAIFIY